MDKSIEGSGLKTLGVELKSKTALLEKRLQEKKEDLDSVKRSLSEAEKGLGALKVRLEKETSKQLENFEAKISSLERSVNVNIPKEFAKIDSGQKAENDRAVQNIRKQVEANNQELEKLNTKLAQAATKSDLQTQLESLETRLDLKLDSVTKKSGESQNILNDWLTKLSQKSEEAEKSFEDFRKSLQRAEQESKALKDKLDLAATKTELKGIETKFDFRLKTNEEVKDQLVKKISDLELNFSEVSRTAEELQSVADDLRREVEARLNERMKALGVEVESAKVETSQKIAEVESKLTNCFEDHSLKMVDQGKKIDANKLSIQELIQILETLNTTGKKMDTRLSETEKWVSELKTTVNSVISESDVIKLNLKNYQDAFNDDLFKVRIQMEEVATTDELFRKSIENQLMTSLDVKLEQLETSLNVDFAKIQAKIDQSDQSSAGLKEGLETEIVASMQLKLDELKTGFETGLNRLETSLIQLESEAEVKQKAAAAELRTEIETSLRSEIKESVPKLDGFVSTFDELKDNLGKFEVSLGEVSARVESNLDLIHSIDKELGKQLKDFAAKSDLEVIRTGLKSFIFDVTQKVDGSHEEVAKALEQVKSSEKDQKQLKQEMEVHVDHFKQSILDLQYHVDKISWKVADMKEIKNMKEKFAQLDKFDGRNKTLELKLTEIESNVQQLATNAETDRMEIFGEIHSNVKNLNENLRHRFQFLIFLLHS